MADSQSPKRLTRSNSTNNISLGDIKELIVNSQRDIISTFKVKFESLESKLIMLSSRVQNIEDKMNTMCDNEKKKEKEIEELRESVSKVSTELPGQLLHEIEERNFRSLNLIFSGVPESDSGDVASRRSQDEEKNDEISKELEVNIQGGFRTMRIGRPGEKKPRLLKVVFLRHEDRIGLLRNGKALRNSSTNNNVFINPDLTLLQRNNNKLLRAELKRRREAGERVKIRGDRIITQQNNQDFY